MKFQTFIDKDQEERVLIYAHERNDTVESIERLLSESDELTGYCDHESTRLIPGEVFYFTMEGGKLYAVTANRKWLLKCRLYKIEEQLPDIFVKINQSTVANITKVERFEVSIGGSLTVHFKNGYRDYVSRRNLKKIKERMGI
jgi:DNA-binding LytR/AlgR family response regulator